MFIIRRVLVAVGAAYLAAAMGGSFAADNLKQAAEKARQAWTAEHKRVMGFENGADWGGATVTSPVKQGKGAVRWDKHTENSSIQSSAIPHDLSAFNVISFWLHSNAANDATFMIVLNSQHDPKVFSYFSKMVKVNWEGWKKLEFRFRDFGSARNPVGWKQIDSIRLTASGWNQSPDDESVWILDDLDFSYDDKPYVPAINARTYLEAPSAEAFIQNLRPGHPRLVLLDEDLPRIRKFIADDPLGKAWFERVSNEAAAYLRRPVQTHRLPDGRRLLSISRDVMKRIYLWGFMYRLDKDPKWRDRAWEEMQAVVNFPDWNPSHYLDTAEMMHAVGVGYDWFYNDLTEAQRKTIREGLWQHGLRLSYASYMGLPAEGAQGWRKVTNNWNFVCNGGTGMAAMAVLDEMPEKASKMLQLGFRYIQIPIEHFEPDGAWWEGIGYWGYSMTYFLTYLRGLETAFGTDFGFIEALKGTGFSMAGDFPIYLSSPMGSIFNFADSGSGSGIYKHWAFFYLAERFRNPLYLDFQKQRATGDVFDILYYEPFEAELKAHEVALDKYFRKTEVATMRSSWTDRNALFAGVKCGKNGIAHAHQDLGSFIFYGLGEKWAIDMGTESQTYQSHKHHIPRSHFYRIREEGHNTLVFDPDEKYSQGGGAGSEIVRFETSPGDAFAIGDLSEAYRKHVKSARRGYRLFHQRRAFLVQDEFEAKVPSEVWWFSHAGPNIAIEVDASGRSAALKVNDKTCHVHLLAPAGAKFTAMDSRPLPTSPDPEIQQQNLGYRKLGIHLKGVAKETIAVLYAPAFDYEPEPKIDATIVPLDEWKTEAPGPELGELKVGGKDLAGFTPKVFSYTVNLPKGADTSPQVAASAKGAEVQVVQASGFPATARVRVSGKSGESLYAVRMLPPPPPMVAGKPHMKPKPVTVDGVTFTASRHDGNAPASAMDGKMTTRWSASGVDQWLGIEFDKARTLDGISIAWFNGNQRQSIFQVKVSDDGNQWTTVFDGKSSGQTADFERFAFDKPHKAKHVRIVGQGNTSNLWNSIVEIKF